MQTAGASETSSDNVLEVRVRARTMCNNLAASIVAAYSEGKEVVLSAIGPIPVAQALKAVCVANRTLASKGVMLVVVPGLITKNIYDTDTGQMMPWVVSTLRLINLFDNNKKVA